MVWGLVSPEFGLKTKGRLCSKRNCFFKQYVLLIESVIFVQLSLNLDKEEDNRGFKSNWRATNKAFAAKNLLGSHEVSLGVQQTAADSDAGNSLRVCSCRKPGWCRCKNSHGAFTISLLKTPKASSLRLSAPFILVFLLPRILCTDDLCGGSDCSIASFLSSCCCCSDCLPPAR